MLLSRTHSSVYCSLYLHHLLPYSCDQGGKELIMELLCFKCRHCSLILRCMFFPSLQTKEFHMFPNTRRVLPPCAHKRAVSANFRSVISVPVAPSKKKVDPSVVNMDLFPLHFSVHGFLLANLVAWIFWGHLLTPVLLGPLKQRLLDLVPSDHATTSSQSSWNPPCLTKQPLYPVPEHFSPATCHEVAQVQLVLASSCQDHGD